MVSAQEQPKQPTAQGINLYSPEREAQWGNTIAAEIERNVTVLRNPALDAYFGRLIGDPKYRVFVFHQTADGVVGGAVGMPIGASSNTTGEVIALPPGTLFVSDRVLLDSMDQAEFARKIAHAMAHLTLRHATKVDSREQIASYATLPMVFMSGGPVLKQHPDAGPAGAAVRPAVQVLVPLGFQRMAKQYEGEADQASVEILAGLHLDAAGFARAQAAVR